MLNKRSKARTPRAFTLMELLLVITIISILSAMVVPKLVGHTQRAKITSAKQTIVGTFVGALGQFEQAVGRYPTSEEGFGTLLEYPQNPDWDGPYIQSAFLPLDPWKNEYKYTFPSQLTSSTILFDVVSAGPDRVFGNEDDISNHDFSSIQQK